VIRRARAGIVAVLLLLVGAGQVGLDAQEGTSHLVVVVGLGGDHENAERFHRWAVAIVDSAREGFGFPADRILYFGEDPARDPRRVSGRSTRETISAAVTTLAAKVRPGDRVFVVLIGHGASATPGAPKFNLPGPDLTAAEFGRLMDQFAAQTVTFVNTASASGGFVAPLSGRGRTVITATRSDAERNQTRFAEFLAEAMTSPDADGDKDGRVSILEVFTYTRGRVVASYERDGQLLTEHAVLDDNGDGKGVDTPGGPGVDGALARTVFLSAGAGAESTDAGADPEMQALLARRKTLEDKLAELKASRDTQAEAVYERELEQALIELARVGRAIREKQKR
jgi:hypothetical protein